MSRAGGAANKLGNYFEAVWTVDAVIDVYIGAYASITVEAFGDESLGVEFHLENLDGSLQFHSAKRQKQDGDWSIVDLCKGNAKTGRSILGDLFEKRRVHSTAELRFVSSTGANELREMCERADTPTNIRELRSALSAALQSKFDDRIVPLCGGDERNALRCLKAMEVVLRSHRDLIRAVNRRIELLFYRTDRLKLNPDNVRRMFAEFVLDNLGPKIDAEKIGGLLATNQIGVRDWKTDTAVNQTVAAINRRYLNVTETELINSAQIAREIVGKISETIADSASHGALVVAPGGYGKSCVLAQCVSRLASEGTPFLCLRMDSLHLCNTTRQLGDQLDLPASPAVVLAGISDNAPSVLVVDQLDAMSLVSGRNPQLWEVFQELCEEVRAYPHMKMILACRDFDLNHDHRLRKLGNTQSGFEKFTLNKLTDTDVLQSLDTAGFSQLNLGERQLEILSVPFHLLLFLQGAPCHKFQTVGELYDGYWKRKRQNLRARLGRETHWNEVVDALTQKMSARQVLFAPKVVVDDWEDDAQAMASEHVLVEAGGQYRFFHESFFDYAYARRFCASGQGVVEYLESTEQHLFRRAQVRQILAYRREIDFAQYLDDLRQIFESPNVRFHIKRMVASGLNQIEKPMPEEWSIVEPLLLDGELSRYLSPALRDHVGWFDLLDSLRILEQWLAADNSSLINAAIWYLESRSVLDSNSVRVAELITPYVGRDDNDWRPRIQRIMSWGAAHKSAEMALIFRNLVSSGSYDDASGTSGGDLWSQLHDAEEEAPRFVIDVLALWFDRTVARFDDGETWKFLNECNQNRSHTGALTVGVAANKEPGYFVEQMLSRVISTVLKTENHCREEVRNRAWPYLSNNGDPFGIDDAILLNLRKALQHLAQQNVASYRRHVAPLISHPHQTVSYLLLRSWADNPQEFADECAQFFVADKRRFAVGYASWIGSGQGTGHCAVTRATLKAITPYCSDELFKQLESRIIGYTTEYEKQRPNQRGFIELLLLRALDRVRISSDTAMRIEELERKFPTLTDTIVEEDNTSMPTFVGSPIPPDAAEKMSDRQWISAMQKYDGSTDSFKGGPDQLSQLLSEYARKDRKRFGALVESMPDNLDAMYFSAIIDGLCSRHANLNQNEKEADQLTSDATPTELFLSVIERLHSLPDKPCGSAIVGCIRILAERSLPPRVLDVVSYYATSDPDPASSRQDVSDAMDLHTQGINCVRGQAAEAISSLLYADPARMDALRAGLNALVTDSVEAVRTCAIVACLPLLNFSRDIAVELFLQACGRSTDICGTRPFERFIYYAVHTHYPQLRNLLQFALTCNNTVAVENVSAQIVLADLNEIDVGQDASNICEGTETQRKAAVEVYAKHLSNKVVGDTCAMRLQEFFNDEARSVHKAMRLAFWKMSGQRLLELQDFIGRLIEHQCFEATAEGLLRALEESNAELPQIICRAAERALEFLGSEGTHVAFRGASVARGIATLVIRQYEQATGNRHVKRTHIGAEKGPTLGS